MGGYLLGEFGHLIADSAGCDAHARFGDLYFDASSLNCACARPAGARAPRRAHRSLVANDTRALLLTSFAKLGNLYADLIPPVKALLRQHADEVDPELQKVRRRARTRERRAVPLTRRTGPAAARRRVRCAV